jgi:nucleotide-binding universal stress UspA family protein
MQQGSIVEGIPSTVRSDGGARIAISAVVHRILCAVTFSPSARRIVEAAASLASSLDAELRLLHVIGAQDGREHGRSRTANAEALERLPDRVMALSRGLPGRPRVAAAVTTGNVAEEILGHARLTAAEIIVMGVDQDAPINPIFAQVVAGAPCPVLAVAALERDRRRAATSLVCGVEFTSASLAAADYGMSLARTLGAQLAMIHVVPEQWHVVPESGEDLIDSREVAEEHARRYLRLALRDRQDERRREIDHVAVTGCPCVEIVRLATTTDAGIIILGQDDRSTPSKPFGRTCACVLQFAPCPVMLVPGTWVV